MMERAPDQNPEAGEDVHWAVLLFALLGPAVAWSIHLGVVYLLVTLLCAAEAGNGDIWVYLSGIPFLAVSIAAGAVALRKRRMLRAGAGWKPMLARPRGSAGLILTMGLVAAGVFSIIIVLQSMAPLFIPTCAESLP
jgi:hypothetical protein